MAEIIPFPSAAAESAPEDLELEEMDREQLLAALKQVRAQLSGLDEQEPEDMNSEEYDAWGDRHELMEDVVDEIMDRLDDLEG